MRLAVCNHGKQASARVIVFGVRLKVLCKLLNSLRQYGNLHLRRAGILIVDGCLLDDFLFLGLGNHGTIIARLKALCNPFPSRLFRRPDAIILCDFNG